MRTSFLVVSISYLIGLGVHAQTNTFPASGNVGIGTLDPAFKLEVAGRAHVGSGSDNVSNTANGLSVQDAGGGNVAIGVGATTGRSAGLVWNDGAPGVAYLYTFSNAAPLVLTARDLHFNTAGVERVAMTPEGRVGIGTATPGAALHVVGDVSLGYWNNTVSRSIGTTQSDNNFAGAGSSVEFTSQADGTGWSNEINFRTHHCYVSAGVRMKIDKDGNVGIGTACPTNKLEVNGTIRGKEMIVETTGWSDYVLSPDYRLTPLSEIEAHIRTMGTLPGIPSTAEVADKGVCVGDMQAKLLAKIEEMTLHMIALSKQVDAQANQLSVQSAEISALKAENAVLRTE